MRPRRGGDDTKRQGVQTLLDDAIARTDEAAARVRAGELTGDAARQEFESLRSDVARQLVETLGAEDAKTLVDDLKAARRGP